jgi:hypothetical protein
MIEEDEMGEMRYVLAATGPRPMTANCAARESPKGLGACSASRSLMWSVVIPTS